MEQLVNFIIRPPRSDYSPKHDLLEEEFMLKGRMFHRKDLQVKNGQGLTLQCSHYLPCQFPEGNALPCVIYCHGNSGCRADASEAAIILLPSNITVFTLDFSGSGLSEGEHVTLGWNEKEDLRAAVDYLRKDGNVSCIGLWGRSMGAVTSLLYGVEDPSIAGMVLDSPFSNLVDLMMELVDTYKYPLPKFTVKLAIQHMRRVIKKKANFDIMDLDTVQVAKCSFVPALFGHATDDDFIRPHHSDQIYDSYTGDKNIIKFDGDHNSPRPQFYFDSITIFFHNVLNPPKGVYDELFYHTNSMHDYFHQDHWEAVNGLDHNSNNIMLPSFEPTIVSTEDAINQVRLRRPMSRTDVPSDISHQDRLPGTGEEQSTSSLHPSCSSPVAPCPTSADEQYWEYSVDSSLDMPSSIEDEERMLTEAILMSLKDSGITRTNEDGHKESTPSTIECPTTSSNAADIAVPVGPSSRNSTSDPAVTTSTTHTDKLPNGNVHSTLDASSSTHETDAVTGTTTKLVAQKNASGHISDKLPNGNNSKLDASSSTQETDAVAGTTAKLVVQKSASGHILDGLAQKWSNLFKSSG